MLGTEHLGALFVEVQGRIDNLEKNLKTAEDKISAFEKKSTTKMQNISKGFKAAGKAAAGMSIAIAGALAIGTKEALDFSSQMAKVSTQLFDDVTTAEDEVAKRLEEFGPMVREMSKEYGQATTDISNGLYDILSSSIDASEGPELLTTALDAAVGGFTKVDTSLSAIITLMKAFKKETSEAADISDFLFSVVLKGRVTYEEVASTLGRVASSAAVAGMSMETMGAAFAAITLGGLEATEAVVGLDAAIATFLRTTQDAKDIAAGYGIELTSETISGEGLLDVMKKLSHLTADQIAQIFTRRRALRAILILLQNLAQFEENIGIMYDRSGAALTAKEKAMAAADHQMKVFKQTVIDMLRELGINFIPLLLSAAEKISNLINWFQALPEPVKKAISIFLILIATLGTVAVAVNLLMGDLIKFIFSLDSVKVKLLALNNSFKSFWVVLTGTSKQEFL
jgi:TP901 family phage tail tape measure protein